MQFSQAIEIVEQVQASRGLPGLLETLECMEHSVLRQEFSAQELLASRVVCTEMRKLFYPA